MHRAICLRQQIRVLLAKRTQGQPPSPGFRLSIRALDRVAGLRPADSRGRLSQRNSCVDDQTHVAKLRARYNKRMKSHRSPSPRYTSPRYTPEHASAGLDHDFPEIETWPNQFPGYEIVVDDPEFTSLCPETGLPDFGNIVIRYVPDRLCLELKSLKEYLQSYRNLGIFQENVVNQVLEDVVRWAKPVWAE